MKQTVERDPETGLAALPEGYIWRVDYKSSRWLTLSMVGIFTRTVTEPKWWIFGGRVYTTTEEEEFVSEYLDLQQFGESPTREKVAEGLAKLSEKLCLERMSQEKQWALMGSFRGDYPPKTALS